MNFDKKIINYNFSSKVYSYNSNANIQKKVAKNLCKFFLQNFTIKNNQTIKILDLGSGTSFIAKNLQKKIDACEIYELDLSFEMLNYFQKNPKKITKICADIENLPFTESSFDIIISSFSLQWIQDFENLFDNLKKLLKPRGILAFALPDNNSFKELKSSPFFVNKMPALLDLSKILTQNNLNQKLIKNEKFYEKFPNLIEALKAFKKIGANYNFQGERSKLKNFKELRNFYLKNFQNNLKLTKLSWSISYFIYSKND